MARDLALNSLGFAKPPSETRVLVAMSGGVDSSVVAAELAAEGYDVIGITLQLYDHGAALAKKGACCAGRDIHDARRVAETLGFPHYVLDYENTFREAVIDEFADAYLAGATPVPCIRCNERVKFRDLLQTARELDADCMATGHYIQRKLGPHGAELHMAADPTRDQSYFLFSTTREQLDYLRFPLGHLALQGRNPGAGGETRAGGGRQAGQPGHLLRAERQLCRGDREAAPRRRRSGRDRGHGRERPGAAPRRHPLHDRPAPRPGHRRARRPALRRPAGPRGAARRRRARRRRCAAASSRCARSTGWATPPSTPRRNGRSRCASARPARRPRRSSAPPARTPPRSSCWPRGRRQPRPGLRLLRDRRQPRLRRRLDLARILTRRAATIGPPPLDGSGDPAPIFW
jgi:hypothetical protein